MQHYCLQKIKIYWRLCTFDVGKNRQQNMKKVKDIKCHIRGGNVVGEICSRDTEL